MKVRIATRRSKYIKSNRAGVIPSTFSTTLCPKAVLCRCALFK